VGDPNGLVVAMGRVFISGNAGVTGKLYMVDPSQPPGDAVVVADVPDLPTGLGFDGSRLWVGGGGVSIVTPGPSLPWAVTSVSTGFQFASFFVFDGANIWVSDIYANAILKLDSAGSILQTVPVGINPLIPVFDGENIWVPNIGDNTITVVRAATGAIIATLSGNGLSSPTSAAFDGARVLITSVSGVSLWNAASIAPLGSVSVDGGPFRACSDGINFWFTLGIGQVARF
jgi:hypothetical protein